MKNGSLTTAKIIVSFLVLFTGVVLAWADVKNKTNTNETNIGELKKENKEARKDRTKLLVQQTRMLTILEEWKKTN